MTLHFTATCPCCAFSVVVVAVVVVWLTTLMSKSYLQNIFPSKKGIINKLLIFLVWVTSFSVGVLAIGLGLLSSTSHIRSIFFSKFCFAMTRSPIMDPIRCQHIRNLNGRVLEIGPGPGANFRCWPNATISHWTGIEPNLNFAKMIVSEKSQYNLTFPTETLWLNGEDFDVPPHSYDYVVGSHVLCSVHDVKAVLKQVSRALKAGGTYYFIEHVSATPGSMESWLQWLISPIVHIVGNGCTFRPLWTQLSSEVSSGGALPGFEVHLEHIRAPLPLTFLKPHVHGYAIKK